MNEYNDTDIEIEKRWSQLEKQRNQPNGSHRIENEKNDSQAILTCQFYPVMFLEKHLVNIINMSKQR